MDHTLSNREHGPGAVRLYSVHMVKLNMAEQLVSAQVTGNNRCIVLMSVVTVDPSSSLIIHKGW